MFRDLHLCGNQSSDDDLDNLPGWVVKIPFKYRRQLPAQKKRKEKNGEKGVLKHHQYIVIATKGERKMLGKEKKEETRRNEIPGFYRSCENFRRAK
ncbi:hypothetical protein NPIL_242991 [Nephila pilipes]|uniref:Uncharacterized protein n=1 Tax=Nephila pilipes TaxID=299642 RepID=A0A8X6TVH3_NEPPI|nr:hypothetical protein NPIL_242991 [Nephila pilipes]